MELSLRSEVLPSPRSGHSTCRLDSPHTGLDPPGVGMTQMDKRPGLDYPADTCALLDTLSQAAVEQSCPLDRTSPHHRVQQAGTDLYWSSSCRLCRVGSCSRSGYRTDSSRCQHRKVQGPSCLQGSSGH
ncbi:hypothetical protein EGW08_011307 [Elysia chlorotica]|uniref:Uncharacterized protein n=1 Tax=Elysia chlorotica TaxID=188477 RepID=A0A3S1BHM6_ELYCH|nr:hypothetical protein EGW08_011307 [Elysia chlorotica]